MKEKRVDVYLSEVALCQLTFIGIGGSFLNEVIQDEPRLTVVIASGLAAVGVYLFMRRMYSKANSIIIKKSKK